MKCTFTWDRSTKETERYKEVVPDGEQAKIGTLYIKKQAIRKMTTSTPEKLEVEIVVVE